MTRVRRTTVNLLAISALAFSPAGHAQVPAPAAPTLTLVQANALQLTGEVDSNSPVVWDVANGVPELHLFTSTAGTPSRAVGRSVSRLGEALPISLSPWPGGGVWIEAIIKSDDGIWYGYYHNEKVASECGQIEKVMPRIGAARSDDQGATWTDLGVVLQAPPDSYACDTPNNYFVGGVGDFSAILNPDRTELYIFYSEYAADAQLQGVAVARLAWANRDEPTGKVTVWNDGLWLPATPQVTSADDETTVEIVWTYPPGTPIYRAAISWHDPSGAVDAFWGPSVHWNTQIQRYVMLLNRAVDAGWRQEGIYAAIGTDVADPTSWSPPNKILDGGDWYPQVIGLEPGGTDKIAGALARLFVGGHSDRLIQFAK